VQGDHAFAYYDRFKVASPPIPLDALGDPGPTSTRYVAVNGEWMKTLLKRLGVDDVSTLPIRSHELTKQHIEAELAQTQSGLS
jgi:hypothetical protein